jgi:hypothetical protein
MIKKILDNMDKGFYKEAKAQSGGPRQSFGYLSDLLAAQGIVASEAEIAVRVQRLAPHAGITGGSFEKLTPARIAQFERFAADTYGLEKALSEVGICTKGPHSDIVEKFFGTTSSAVLFPAYVESQIVLGMLAASILGSLIATETNINAHTYKSLAYTDVAAQQQLGIAGEGALLPKVKITTADRSIDLYKFGCTIEATYSAIRLQRIDVLSIHLQRIGMRIALDECDWAIETLIAGDGNTGSAMSGTDGTLGLLNSEVSTVLDYDELVRLFGAFTTGYQMRVAVANWTNLRTILNMAEFKDPMSGFNFQSTGVLPGPMGANWQRWDSTGSTNFSTDRILAIDNRFALEQVTEQGVVTESDKLIEAQIDQSVITKWTGFAKLDYNAAKCLDITHA